MKKIKSTPTLIRNLKALHGNVIELGKLMSNTNLDIQIDTIKNEIDALNEMGEIESLRLQMAMDRLSNMMTMLSNILKKINETSNAIIQNIK